MWHSAFSTLPIPPPGAARITFYNQISSSRFFLPVAANWLCCSKPLGSRPSYGQTFPAKELVIVVKAFPITTTHRSQGIWGTAQNNKVVVVAYTHTHICTHPFVNWPWFWALLLNFMLLCLFPQISWLRWKWKQVKGCKNMDETQSKLQQNYPYCNHNVLKFNLARSLKSWILEWQKIHLTGQVWSSPRPHLG